ncbi:MAG: hypothetical protein ACLRSD_16575 [Oscillibacter sp.]
MTVIEGVMGYYDGIGFDSSRASTFEVAQRTESPVVLVLNAKGAGLSVLAVLDGFLHFTPENRIRGVILNGCTAMSYPSARAGDRRTLRRARLRLSAANARLLAREPPPRPHHRGRGE